MSDIVLIEDDRELGALIRDELKRAGFACRWARSARDGLRELDHRIPDLVLLDLQLPDRSGFDVLPELRARTAVLVVTARIFGEDKVRALDLGADDYVTKPFWAAELLARVRAVLRRTRGGPASTDVLVHGELRIDSPGRQVFIAGALCALTPTEFNLLQCLATRPGRALRHEQLMDAVLPHDGSATEALQVHVSRLRKKLGQEGWRIRTVWGVGYRLETGDGEQ